MATGVPRTIVEHVLVRWAVRNLVIANRLFDGWRVDRFTAVIQRLSDADRDPNDKQTRTRGLSDMHIASGPRYRIVAQFIGVDMVALSDFGGELGDPVAAAVRVGGSTVVQVVAPIERSDWTAKMEERFRSEVRRLAAHHELLDRQGEVRVVFDPPQSSVETRDLAAGKLIERRS